MAFPLSFCCPACQSGGCEGVGGVVVKCLECGLGLQHRLPADPGKLYSRLNYDEHRAEESCQPPAWSRFWHDYAVGMMRMMQLDGVLPKSGLWVDFGCGNGGLLAAARESGFDPLGVELDPSFCQEVLVNTGIFTCSTQAFFANPANTVANYTGDMLLSSETVVSLFDVLEHLVDPVGNLDRVIRSVQRVGREVTVMVVEVPDFDAAPQELSKWKHLRPDEHLTHWSREPLDRVGKRLGFRSRQYQTPIKGKIQAVWQHQE